MILNLFPSTFEPPQHHLLLVIVQLVDCWILKLCCTVLPLSEDATGVQFLWGKWILVPSTKVFNLVLGADRWCQWQGWRPPALIHLLPPLLHHWQMKRTHPILHHPGARKPLHQVAVNGLSIKVQPQVMLKWVMIHHYQKTCCCEGITSFIKNNKYHTNFCNRNVDGDVSEVALLKVAAI